MPTITGRKTTAPPETAVPLSFDERLKLAALSTSDSPFDLADVITGPVAVPKTPMTPRATPIANLIQQAGHILATDGWCQNARRDEDGKRCLYGAIRAAAGSDRSAEANAVTVVMEAIRREFGGDSIPTFNDRARGLRPIMRVLDSAVSLAEAKGV